MRGFSPGAVIPKRDLSDLTPMRFSLIVRLHPEKDKSHYVLMPESYKKHKDSTRGWFGTIVAVGASILRMKDMIGVISAGTVCLFDESVSVDDPNRCFDDQQGNRMVMFDLETIMGVLGKNGEIRMLGDRVLVRRVKKADYKQTTSKLWIPEVAKPEVGGVVVAVGPGLPGSKVRLPMDFKPGQFVLFSKFSGTDIKIEGVDHLVVRQDRILAVVHGETERIQFA